MLVFFMCCSGLAEMITLGSIVPFLAAIVDPKAALNFVYFQGLFSYFKINEENLVMFLSIVFCLAIVMSAIIRLGIAKMNLKWTYGLISDLAIEVYEKTLYQSYEVHSSRNSSEIISGITQKIPLLLSGVFLPLVISIQYSILIVSIIFALILVLPIYNILALGSFAILYAAFSIFLKKKLNLNSEIISIRHVGAIKILQESLLNIRGIILGDYYKFYLSKYAASRKATEVAAGSNAFMSQLPRFLIEAVAILLIVAIALSSYSLSSTASEILPSLGLLALGAQRLMPCLQGLYAAFASIEGSYQSAEDAIFLLDQSSNLKENLDEQNNKLEIKRSIGFKNMSFRYSGAKELSLRNINLEIKKGEIIGLIGSTGSGKSTLVDTLMGLLKPSEGSLVLDGRELSFEQMPALQKIISHVPQQIFIADASIRENIALGLEADDVSEDRVIESAKKSQLIDFINSLKDGLDTIVGENGSKLSGGERQRIGIARAFYEGGSILVLDEATNALDMKTANNIVEIIKGLDDDLVVIIVAHNLATIKDCDRTLILESGSLVNQGKLSDISKSESYKKISGELM